MTGPITPAAIADLVRARTTTLQEAADLIQHYAEAYAIGEVTKAMQQQHDRYMAMLEGPLTRRVS
jgi:DNA-binding transcriptional regulator YbjK